MKMTLKLNLFWTLILFGISINLAKAPPPRRHCTYKQDTPEVTVKETKTALIDSKPDSSDEYDEYEDAEADIIFDSVINETDNGSIACPKDQHFCYTLWTKDKNGTQVIMSQGCWSSADNVEACNSAQCVGERTMKSADLKFCCCTGDFCNNEFSVLPDTKTTAETTDSPDNAPEKSIFDSFFVWISFLMVAAIILNILVFLLFRKKPKAEPETAPLATGYPSGPGYSSNLYNVDNLKLVSLLGQGKYGTVWKGMVNEQPVAVKIFNAHNKQYFLNEKNIYMQPFMESPALLTYFGCDERRTLDDRIEYLLVLSIAPLGCLQDWLLNNTASFEIFSNMAKSVARGLSHMHTEIRRGDQVKLCMAHRDLNTRNILVKQDLTCCLCDFGFATRTSGPRYEYRGEMILAETKSINEVGTLRYMAPEELEGAVNLRDCETSLKQIDVYSLGLVLWELCTRCHDFYPSEQAVPNYAPPYEAELQGHMEFEKMQVLVSRHKARPLFPPSWGGNGVAAKIAKETCEDCWDHDAEARLTSLCVEERLNEMAMHKPKPIPSRGASPPLSKNNLIPSSPPTIINTSPTYKEANVYSTIITPPNQSITTASVAVTNHVVDEHTIETMISPTTPNSNVSVQIKNKEIFSHQIQPFQGKNPCLERNLATTGHSNASSDKSHKKYSVSNGGTNININNNDLYYNLDEEVLVEEFLNRNIPSTTIISRSHQHSGEGIPKQSNIDKKQNRWIGIRDLLQRKFFKRNQTTAHNIMLSNEELSSPVGEKSPINRNIHLNLIENHQTAPVINAAKIPNGEVKTVSSPTAIRPSNLDISPIVVSQTFKKLPNDKQEFTVITSPRIVISKSANAVKTLNVAEDIDKNLKRQRSLEVFREVFGPKGSVERLRDVNQRIKTPGDVPASVRKVRASKTLSLYDDRMMDPGQFAGHSV